MPNDIALDEYTASLWYKNNLSLAVIDESGRFPVAVMASAVVPSTTLDALDAEDLSHGWSAPIVAKARAQRSTPRFLTVGARGACFGSAPELRRASGNPRFCNWLKMFDLFPNFDLRLSTHPTDSNLPANWTAKGQSLASAIGVVPKEIRHFTTIGGAWSQLYDAVVASPQWAAVADGTSNEVLIYAPIGHHNVYPSTSWLDCCILVFDRDDPQVAGLRGAYLGLFENENTNNFGVNRMKVVTAYVDSAAVPLIEKPGRTLYYATGSAITTRPTGSTVPSLRVAGTPWPDVVPLDPDLKGNNLKLPGSGGHERFGVAVFKGVVIGGPSFVNGFGYNGVMTVDPFLGGCKLRMGAGIRDMEWAGATLLALQTDPEATTVYNAEAGEEAAAIASMAIRTSMFNRVARVSADPFGETACVAEVKKAGGGRSDIANTVMLEEKVFSDGTVTPALTFDEVSKKVARLEYDKLHIVDKISAIGVNGYGCTIDMNGGGSSAITYLIRNADNTTYTPTDLDEYLMYYLSGAILIWRGSAANQPPSLVEAFKAYIQVGSLSFDEADAVDDGVYSEFNELSVYGLWADPWFVPASSKAAQEMVHLVKPRKDLDVVSVSAIIAGRITSKKFGVSSLA